MKSKFKDECDECHEFHILTNYDGKLLCDQCAEKRETHYEQLSLFDTLFDV